jgi:prepilin-type N-terminal cleavage/methylation domain-containing protein
MITNHRRRCSTASRGFTLAEAMMATVVLGIAAAGVLLPFASGAGVRAEGTRRTLGAKLAGDLIEQIINTPYEQIVSKYDGYSEPQGQLKDSAGIVFTDPSYANFSRGASCAYVYVPQQGGTYQANFVRVTVRVYYRARPIASINRLVAR